MTYESKNIWLMVRLKLALLLSSQAQWSQVDTPALDNQKNHYFSKDTLDKTNLLSALTIISL